MEHLGQFSISTTPLCGSVFGQRLQLTDDASGQSIKLYQRFIFNLSWSPEDFREISHDSSELVASGELELF